MVLVHEALHSQDLAGGALVSPFLLGLCSLVLLAICLAILSWRKGGKHDDEATKQAVPDDAPDLEPGKKRLVLLFGTQTGTAERFAQQIGEEAQARYGDHTAVRTMDIDEYGASDEDYEEGLCKEETALFFVATYGDGEPTDSAIRFHKWIVTKAEEAEEGAVGGALSNLSYGVFGLGNKQYEHFNAMAKGLDNQLSNLGARRLLDVGLGDDDACIEDDFMAWRDLLWPVLDEVLSGGEVSGAGKRPFSFGAHSYTVVVHDKLEEDEEEDADAGVANGLEHAYDAHHPYRAQIAARRELHSPLSDRSCLHVEIDIAGVPGLSYQPGDHVGVYAENSPGVVEAAAVCLGMPLDMVFSLQVEEGKGSASLPFTGPLSLRAALARYSDILTPPRKSALAALASHSTDPVQAQRLRFLSEAAGREEYASWVVADQRSLVEVMEAFPSARPPLGVFFCVIAPRLQPRYYSISSSPRAYPDRVHITCALVRGPSPTGRLHEGVCSTWFERAIPIQRHNGEEGRVTRAPIFIRPSTFRLPTDPTVPIVMIGPGTGLAPFRGFLQERSALMEAGQRLGPAHLFYGCRDRKKDFIYEEELRGFVAHGALTELHLAFSREGGVKDYVQHRLLEQGSEMWRLLASKAMGGDSGLLYVCGDAKHMAKDVHRTLLTIVQGAEAVTGSQAEDIVKQLQSEGRYQRDVW